MAFVYINHGSRPDIKIGSHEGSNPDARRRQYVGERGVKHDHQFAVPVPDGTAEKIERLVHSKLGKKRVSNNTELFFCDLDEAKLVLIDAIAETCGPGEPKSGTFTKDRTPVKSSTTSEAHLLDFDVTHGQTTEERRSISILKWAVSEAVTRPNKGGRKLEAIFEAQNENGLLAKYRANTENAPIKGEIAAAIHYVEKYGGEFCVPSWPKRPELNQAFKIIERQLA